MPDLTEGTPASTASDAAVPATAPASQPAAPAADAPASVSQPANTEPTDATATKPADGEAPKTGDKPAEQPAEVNYEFKLPDGVELKGEALDELKATAKEFGLTQEQAQRIADLGVKQAQGFAAQLVEQQKTLSAEWAQQTTNDKDIGGDKLSENLGVAKKALDSFGTPELKTLLNQSGLGNHPEIVRFMVKAGKAISEDGKLVTGAAAQADRANTPIANRLYPNQK
ncbi:protease [Paraburkholderia atlantica]|uniref:protease n=1 Tax=Paraburkholderia atlantica TaxID=2654982 RepID=UPI003D197B04